MRSKMWFGTPENSRWIDAPLRGAEMSPVSIGTDGTLVSGGGFSRHSLDSHREYIFEWASSSSRDSAEIIQAYRDGAYNTYPSDLIYFHDPLTYDRNVLPKRWAQPTILLPPNLNFMQNTPLGTLERGSTPPPATFSNTVPRNPVRRVTGRNLSYAEFGPTLNYRLYQTLWVPIPEGMTLGLAAWAVSSGQNGLYAMSRTGNNWSAKVKLTDSLQTFTGDGVLLGIVGVNWNFFGARGVLFRTGKQPPLNARGTVEWLPGSGHSGCRFVGNPTWTANSGTFGGQIGYAATLREVGDWER